MRKIWEEPTILIQKFIPNEYVAVCVEGTIQCAIPGNSPYRVADGTGSRNYNPGEVTRNLWSGPTLSYDGQDHGLCGTAAPITFSDSNGTGSGFEINNGSIDRNRPIYNIAGYDLTQGTGTYNVTWNSNSGGPTYNHYGVLTVSYIDSNNPNHS